MSNISQALVANNNKKKKKNYALFLYDEKAGGSNNFKLLEKAILAGLSEFIIVRSKDPDEALKILVFKGVDVVIIDSSFFSHDAVSVEYALEIKKHRNAAIFFVPTDEKLLVKEYRKKMFAYAEKDDYFISPIDVGYVTQKLKLASSIKGRAHKRFSIDLPACVHKIDNNEEINVQLVDVSLSGIGFTVDRTLRFEKNEQLRISIPLAPVGIFHKYYGEFLKIALRVQRYSITGTKVGCSLEFLTPLQIEALMMFIESSIELNKNKSTSKILRV
jgi:hypothetical protein